MNHNLKERLLIDISKYQNKKTILQDISYCEAGRSSDELIPFLIKKNHFIDYFDLHDLLEMRGSSFPFEEISNIYNSSWFNYEKDMFEIPEFSLYKDNNRNIKTRIQTGRHRTIVLLRFVDFIPISYNRTLSESEDIPAMWKRISDKDVIQIPKFDIADLGISGR